MSLELTHEPTTMHSGPGSSNQSAERTMLVKVMWDYGQHVDNLIREYELEAQREIKPGIKFENAFKS